MMSLKSLGDLRVPYLSCNERTKIHYKTTPLKGLRKGRKFELQKLKVNKLVSTNGERTSIATKKRLKRKLFTLQYATDQRADQCVANYSTGDDELKARDFDSKLKHCDDSIHKEDRSKNFAREKEKVSVNWKHGFSIPTDCCDPRTQPENMLEPRELVITDDGVSSMSMNTRKQLVYANHLNTIIENDFEQNEVTDDDVEISSDFLKQIDSWINEQLENNNSHEFEFVKALTEASCNYEASLHLDGGLTHQSEVKSKVAGVNDRRKEKFVNLPRVSKDEHETRCTYLENKSKIKRCVPHFKLDNWQKDTNVSNPSCSTNNAYNLYNTLTLKDLQTHSACEPVGCANKNSKQLLDDATELASQKTKQWIYTSFNKPYKSGFKSLTRKSEFDKELSFMYQDGDHEKIEDHVGSDDCYLDFCDRHTAADKFDTKTIAYYMSSNNRTKLTSGLHVKAREPVKTTSTHDELQRREYEDIDNTTSPIIETKSSISKSIKELTKFKSSTNWRNVKHRFKRMTKKHNSNRYRSKTKKYTEPKVKNRSNRIIYASELSSEYSSKEMPEEIEHNIIGEAYSNPSETANDSLEDYSELYLEQIEEWIEEDIKNNYSHWFGSRPNKPGKVGHKTIKTKSEKVRENSPHRPENVQSKVEDIWQDTDEYIYYHARESSTSETPQKSSSNPNEIDQALSSTHPNNLLNHPKEDCKNHMGNSSKPCKTKPSAHSNNKVHYLKGSVTNKSACGLSDHPVEWSASEEKHNFAPSYQSSGSDISNQFASCSDDTDDIEVLQLIDKDNHSDLFKPGTKERGGNTNLNQCHLEEIQQLIDEDVKNHYTDWFGPSTKGSDNDSANSSDECYLEEIKQLIDEDIINNYSQWFGPSSKQRGNGSPTCSNKVAQQLIKEDIKNNYSQWFGPSSKQRGNDSPSYSNQVDINEIQQLIKEDIKNNYSNWFGPKISK